MKVDITHGQKTVGLFSKKTYHTVTVDVKLSDEEKMHIKQNNLGNHILAERPVRAGLNEPPDPEIWNLRVRHMIDKPNVFEFYTPTAARHYHDEVMAGLKGLADFMKSAGKGVTNTSVEM